MAGIAVVQAPIASTGVNQQLPSRPGPYKNFTLTAHLANTADISVVVNATNASTTGYLLAKGASVTLNGLNDTASIWINGTAADIISGIGTS